MTIRKKGTWSNGEPKFVIEQDRKYIETLPQEKELIELLRLGKTPKVCPVSTKEDKNETSEKFAYELLNEPKKEDTKKHLVDDMLDFAKEKGKSL